MIDFTEQQVDDVFALIRKCQGDRNLHAHIKLKLKMCSSRLLRICAELESRGLIEWVPNEWGTKSIRVKEAHP